MNFRVIIVITVSVMLKAVIMAWWKRYKDRKSLEPTPLVFRKGVYVPWGTVEKVQHYGWRLTQVWMAYIVVLLAILAYVKLIAPIP